MPAQGPLSVFVHHNTLHAFEDLPFEEAVIEGGRRFGCEPYLSEERYHMELSRGRISREDLREVLMADLQEDADKLVATFGTRYTLRLSMLQTQLQSMPESGLNWLLAESTVLKRFREEVPLPYREKTITQTRAWVMRHLESITAETRSASPSNATSPLPAPLQQRLKAAGESQIHRWNDQHWEAFTLHALWEACQQGIDKVECQLPTEPSTDSLQQLMLSERGVDLNTKIDDILIRFCGSFLDQGFADWTLPDREDGFAKAFAGLFLGGWAIRADWMQHIEASLREVQSADWDAIQSIEKSLQRLGISDTESENFLSECLLMLRGWAGMICQMESNRSFLANPIPEGSLNEYLAIRLILFAHATEHFGKAKFNIGNASEIIRLALKSANVRSTCSSRARTHRVFQLAQLGGWTPEQLLNMSAAQWRCLINEIESFPSLDRRRLLHAAYERHYANQALNAISIHSRRRRERSLNSRRRPAYAAIFCIDDREESFRRHLEEVAPDCRTASAAGFFAVAMYYQGADHASFRPLCPAIVTPQHYVREEPLFSSMAAGQRRAVRRRRLGWFAHQVHQNSRTLVGGWVTGLFGAIATVPMVARILAPRLTAQIRESMGSLVRPPATELHLERRAEDPGSDPESMGYSLTEMSQIVVRILQDIGMVNDFPPIIVFFGHGSGSLNNPHESAYNCGACSGGRGGPNARAFAVMANDPRVRRRVAEQGIELPDDVVFVGAYHNTCNDNVDYYDLDLLPRSLRELFRRIESDVIETRTRNAHERARRFESAPLDLTPQEALEHVEERAEDLSQARPEYNHATNALVTVGRRDWSRGLFMDRRAFVTEYDPEVDNENGHILTRILQAAIPVCGGISLEYYFSTVDGEGYGCGSKLPHNVASMIGVMTGAASDLRPGLSQQMVEIHEPMRILFVIETTPEMLSRIIAENEGIHRMVRGNWVQLAIIDPSTSAIQRYVNGRFEPHIIADSEIPTVPSSMHWYRGQRDHLGFASIQESEIKSHMGSSDPTPNAPGVLA